MIEFLFGSFVGFFSGIAFMACIYSGQCYDCIDNKLWKDK